jgi:hypothetical protein
MNYSSLIIDTSFGNLETTEYKGDIFKQLANYQYAMDGNKTTIYNTKVSLPLGVKYFADSGIQCSNKKQNIYTFVDAKSSQKNILLSASADLSKINNIDKNIENPNFATTKCTKKPVKLTTIGLNGKKKKESKIVGTESFVTPSLQTMNAGQQFFIGSFTVLGLLLFYKAFYKR